MLTSLFSLFYVTGEFHRQSRFRNSSNHLVLHLYSFSLKYFLLAFI